MTGFGFEILLLAGVAGFILYRLYTVLGERTGHEHPPEKSAEQGFQTEGNVVRLPGAEETPPPAAPSAATNALAEQIPALGDIAAKDTAFDVDQFIDGARMAYEMIVEAFAAGDKNALGDLLSRDVYTAFEGAIDGRVARDEKALLTFIGLEKAEIVDARLDGEEAHLTVLFASNQIRFTETAGGHVVSGDRNRIELVKDRWTFARNLSDHNPNWRLSATDAGA
ncbi:MAG: Tim44/TimA family putative adaptor protein [Pseudomonadota bacterium]